MYKKSITKTRSYAIFVLCAFLLQSCTEAKTSAPKYKINNSNGALDKFAQRESEREEFSSYTDEERKVIQQIIKEKTAGDVLAAAHKVSEVAD